MIINAANTQKIPNTPAFKGSTPLRIVKDDKGTAALPLVEGYIKNIFKKGLEEAGTDAAVLDDADNVIAKIYKWCVHYLSKTQEEANAAVLGFVEDNKLSKVIEKEVIKEVPASTAAASTAQAGAATAAKTATETATQIPWKKYGPIAAIAAVAVGVAAFFIGKSAERKRQEKLNGEEDTPTTYKQPQPVLQEAVKPADGNLENFFSATKS